MKAASRANCSPLFPYIVEQFQSFYSPKKNSSQGLLKLSFLESKYANNRDFFPVMITEILTAVLYGKWEQLPKDLAD
jgi:hypothetical protein